MATFGDYEPLDALDTEPADPLQVAVKLHRLRADRGLEPVGWVNLSSTERARRLEIAIELLAWLRRSGAAR